MRTIKRKKNYLAQIKKYEDMFMSDETFRFRDFKNRGTGLKFRLMFFDGMSSSDAISLSVIMPVEKFPLDVSKDITEQIKEDILSAAQIKDAKDDHDIITSVEYGEILLIGEGLENPIIIDLKGFVTRGVQEPDIDKTIFGPREGFTEIIMQNISMLRRRITSNNFCVKFIETGKQTNTKICVCYVNGIVNKRLVNDLISRIENINIDGVLDSNYIAELVCEKKYSLFNTVGIYERPDICVSKLLEGRAVVLVDGSPIALTVPYLFVENFQQNEDYYINFSFSYLNRLLRVVSFFITTCFPAIYLALVTFHPKMIPTPLLLSISAAREHVPFPTVIEIIMMLCVFEILRETGIRMSSNIGQAFSIVGALVLGQSAVEAKIVSAPIIIVVAVSGICSLMIPRLLYTAAIMRLSLVFAAYAFGLYGFLFGIMFYFIHLSSLDSFGVPYMYRTTFTATDKHNDTLTRGSFKRMLFRPPLFTDNVRRAK